MFLYSISAGAGLMSFTLMLLIAFLTTEMINISIPLSFLFLLFLTLKDLISGLFRSLVSVPHRTKGQRLDLTT